MRIRLPFLLSLAAAFSTVSVLIQTPAFGGAVTTSTANGITMAACFSSGPDPGFNNGVDATNASTNSPAYIADATSAAAGIAAGCATNGSYTSGSTFSPGQLIATDPTLPASDGGNVLYDGLLITDNNNPANQFSLSGLTFQEDSSDPATLNQAGDALALAGQYGSGFFDFYSPTAIGIVNCYTAGCTPTIYDDGLTPATVAVDELIFIGAPDAFVANSTPGSAIADQAAYMESNAPFSVTNTYTLYDVNGNQIDSVTNVANVVPEPATLPVAALFFIITFAAYRVRRARA